MKFLLLFLTLSLSACIVVPTNKTRTHTCEISSDLKTLKIVDVAKETNTYYDISGILLTPILLPTSALLSGSYVLVNNIYYLGEKRIKCGKT